MSWAYVIEDPFAVSRIGAALIRWMMMFFWILILDGMMKQQSLNAEKRAETHFLGNADRLSFSFPCFLSGIIM